MALSVLLRSGLFNCNMIDKRRAETGRTSKSGTQPHKVADGGRGFGKRTMVDREQRQLKPVRDPGLVVDAAQIVLYDLFSRSQSQADFFVLVALNDQRNDLHLFG